MATSTKTINEFTKKQSDVTTLGVDTRGLF